MAIAQVGTPQSGTNTSGALTLASYVEAAGTDRIMVVAISMDNKNTVAIPVISVKWNTTESFTQLRSDEEVLGGSKSHAELWYLVSPTVGTFDVVVDFDNGGSGKTQIAGVVSFTGVDQATPFASNIGATGQTNGPATVDVVSTAGEVVIDAISGDQTTLSPGFNALAVGAGQTEQWQDGVSGLEGGGCSTEPGALSVTMSWDNPSVKKSWSISAGSLQPPGAGGGTIVPHAMHYYRRQRSS